MGVKTKHLSHCFLGAGLPVDFGSDGDGPFRKSTSGVGNVDKSSYGLQLNCTAAASAQLAELNQDDVLAFDIDEIKSVEFCARVDSLTDDTDGLEFTLGLAGARNASIDAITPGIFVRIKNGQVCLESNDGAGKNVDDYDTNQTLNLGVWQRYVIDLATGIQTQGPPLQSVGGKARPMFHVSGNGIRRNFLNNVHDTVSFDMSAYSGGLQLFARAEKTNAASVNDATLTIRDINVDFVYTN